MTIAQKTGSDPVIEPDPVRSGVCTYPTSCYKTCKDSEVPQLSRETEEIRSTNFGISKGKSRLNPCPAEPEYTLPLLNLPLLNLDIPCLANSLDPDQLASEEVS